MKNTSGIEPTEYKVLIRPIEVGQKVGSIYIPDETKERDQFAQQRGTLVACSPLAFSYDNWPEDARKPAEGDTVLYAKYAGTTVKGNDGADYRLIADKDIGAILT